MRGLVFLGDGISPGPGKKGLSAARSRVVLPSANYNPKIGPSAASTAISDEFRLCDEVGLDIMVNEHHSNLDLPDDLGCRWRWRSIGAARPRRGAAVVAWHADRQPPPTRCASPRKWHGSTCCRAGGWRWGLVKGAPPYEIRAGQQQPGQPDAPLLGGARPDPEGDVDDRRPRSAGRRVLPLPQRQHLAAGPYQQPTPPVWMTGLSPETGRMAGRTWPCRRHAAVAVGCGGRCSTPIAGGAQELGWTAGPDRFAYAGVVGVGTTREEGLAPGQPSPRIMFGLSVVVAEPFTNPPGYNSLAANIAMLKSGGKARRLSSATARAIRSTSGRRRSSS